MLVYLTFDIKAFERSWTLTIPDKTDEDGDGLIVDDLDDGRAVVDAVGRAVVDAVGRAVVDVFS